MPRAEEPTAPLSVRKLRYDDDAYSIEMPIRLLRSTQITPRGKVVYLALRAHAVERGDVLIATGDQRHFATLAGLTLKTFINGLNELERHQWVVVLRPSEDEKTITVNGQELTIKADRGPGTATTKRHRMVWGSTYILLAEAVGFPI